ncbi:outer membrane beta-barrel protein [Hymenobacter cellulosilyticus]|uniref:PorT family protein n=1 Tax=Hymenobacter cellulosilyticus TaxID=2932248 RepID=A0A8T9Q4W5_9BACT|nr:outer membrane beta-barrel protein [Hymenobacter cellulosilyticus]UOQ70133.1 PorT family protein [Hymenobacter cellulosilyticus]
MLLGSGLSYRFLGGSPTQVERLERPTLGYSGQVSATYALSRQLAVSAGLGYSEYATSLNYQLRKSASDSLGQQNTLTRKKFRDTYGFLTIPVQAQLTLAGNARWRYGVQAGGTGAFLTGAKTTEGSACKCQQVQWNGSQQAMPFTRTNLLLTGGAFASYQFALGQWLTIRPQGQIFLNSLSTGASGRAPRRPGTWVCRPATAGTWTLASTKPAPLFSSTLLILSMMKRLLLSALAAFSLLLPSCQLDSGMVICEDGTTPGPVTVPPTLNALTAQLGAPVQKITYDPTRTNVFTSPNGTVVTIPPNAFLRRGQTGTGPVELSFREVFSRADMVLSNMPTISGGRLLESAGEVYLRADKDSTITMAPGTKLTVQTQTPPNVASRDSMRLFVGGWGGGAGSACFEWSLNRDPTSALQPSAGGASNTITVSSSLYNSGLNWLNCDKFYSSPNPRTTIQVTVPGSNIDPTSNTMVFAVFRTFNGAIRICNFKAPNIFEMPGIPTETPLSVVVIRTVESKLYYGRQNTTAQAGVAVTPTLQETTPAALVDALNQL